jgi:hypothetical protein
VWYFTEDTLDYVVYLGLAYDSARDSVSLSLDSQGVPTDTLELDKDHVPLPLLVRAALGAWNGWEIGTARNLKITDPRWPIDLSKWQRFAQLANPFEPLLDLWRTGYQIVCPFSDEDSTIRLYARFADS